MAYYLYRLATLLVPLLPPVFGYWLFGRAGAVGYFLARRTREQYRRNLARVVPNGTSERELAALVKRGFQNLGRNYYDLFRAHALSVRQLRGQITEIVGLDGLEKVLAEGKGVIGASTHFGNFNMFVLIVAVVYHQRYSVVVPMEHLKPEALNQLVIRLRSRQGVQMVPVEQAGRMLIKQLRAGNFIGLALDRDPTGSGILIDFFGEPARLPDGAVQLSLKYGAPVMLGFARRLADHRTLVTLEPPVRFDKTGDAEADLRLGMERLARIVEKWIRAYPDQWMMFVPVWEADKQN